jgi:hypothetical protein
MKTESDMLHSIEGEFMLTLHEEKQIIKLNHQFSHDITIGLVASQHAISKLLHEFCGDL